MKRILALAVFGALLAGCNANVGFQLGHMGRSATAPSVGPGSSFSSGGVGVRFADIPGASAIIGAAGLGWLFSDPQTGTQRTPPMDETRRVNEQDCRNAVQSAANLRCN